MWFLLGIMFMHFLSDFVMQTDWQALNKSKNNKALSGHVLSYSLSMTAGFALLIILFDVHIQSLLNWVFLLVIFFVITFATHFATDYVTSRVNTYLWSRNRHLFFVSVGFDQFIHCATLFITLYLLGIVS